MYHKLNGHQKCSTENIQLVRIGLWTFLLMAKGGRHACDNVEREGEIILATRKIPFHSLSVCFW